jgi:hypothetical protein
VLAMLALLGVAGAIAARRVPRLAMKMTLVAIVTTLLTGVAFIAQFPGVAGATIDRAAVFALDPDEMVTVISDGDNRWTIIASSDL